MEQRQTELLLSAGRGLIESLDVEAVLNRILEVAREVTGARYAALGVLDERRVELERFVYQGMGPEDKERIGDLPRGKGILGVLITEPQPLRLSSIGDHPRSYGFPPGHPPMDTFLGMPILIRGEGWGNLYLTEKAGGVEFTPDDEEAAAILADWAALAIDNARLYGSASARRDELERAVTALEATSTISTALGAGTDPAHVLELVVKRGRALLGARVLVLFLTQDGDPELVYAAGAGELLEWPERVPAKGTVLGRVLETGKAERMNHATAVAALGLPALPFEPDCALVVPLSFRGRTFGVLAAAGRDGEEHGFDHDSEELLRAFAVNAAAAVATAQSFERQLLDRSIAAAEEERRHWAQELHDETLQDLAGLKMTLAAARRSGNDETLRNAVDAALAGVEHGVEALRHLITELRPAELDELGVGAAVETLISRTSGLHGLRVESRIGLDSTARFDPKVESTLYRLVQESLTNVVKHSGASAASVALTETEDAVEVEVADDGAGFDPAQRSDGFGLIGMRERTATLGGSVVVTSAPGQGTRVNARIPFPRGSGAAAQ